MAKRYDTGGKIASQSGQMIDKYSKGSMSKSDAESDLPKSVRDRDSDYKMINGESEYTNIDDDRIARDGDVINNPKNYKIGGKVNKKGKKSVKAEGKQSKPRLDRMSSGGKPKHWIAGAIKHPGALHKELHVPQGQKIPEKKLEKAEHSSNPTLRKRANLAKTLKGMHK